MVDAVTKAADQAVKDGKLTKAQRDALVSKSTQWVQHEITETHDGHRGFGGPGATGRRRPAAGAGREAVARTAALRPGTSAVRLIGGRPAGLQPPGGCPAASRQKDIARR